LRVRSLKNRSRACILLPDGVGSHAVWLLRRIH
jgi:hypothetical protein